MSDKDFVDQFREKQAFEGAPKKRWGSYSAAEVEAYIEKLNKKIMQTEKVFREHNEDLKRSLKAATRERDELLRQREQVVLEELRDHHIDDLERLLLERDMLIIPKSVYEPLRQADAVRAEKADRAQHKLGQIKVKYQEFLNAHHELQDAFRAFTLNEPAEYNPEDIEAQYQNILESQREDLAKLQDCLADVLAQLKNIIEK